jgi:hypothetical protein
MDYNQVIIVEDKSYKINYEDIDNLLRMVLWCKLDAEITDDRWQEFRKLGLYEIGPYASVNKAKPIVEAFLNIWYKKKDTLVDKLVKACQ